MSRDIDGAQPVRANAATLDDAHLIDGYLAETWQPGTSEIAARRAAVTARGRSQARP